ncbi:MAG TPA: IclR family transcriptional regulator [Chloroflexota bacterium]|nr:IclR family transcriptional regulator [Chloroflexota bacterium]
MKTSEQYNMRAIERVTSIMSFLAGTSRPLTLSEVALGAGLSTPTTFRFLRSLEDQGLVASDEETGKYRLGYRLLEWTSALLRQVDVVAIARPYVVAIRNRVNESVGLAVPSGDYWIRVARADASREVRRVLDIGERAPLHWATTGLVFLAALSDAELAVYIRRVQEDPSVSPPLADLRHVRAMIARVRDTDFAEHVAPRADGSATIAVPLRRHDGQVVAVISVQGPAPRYTSEVRSLWIDTTVRAAREISEALGYRASESDRWPTAFDRLYDHGEDRELALTASALAWPDA